MNKLLRYLIFARLIVGVGYAVYYLMHKPAGTATEAVAKEGEVQQVAEGEEGQPTGPEGQALADATEKPAEEASEIKEETVKVEEVTEDSKPAKR